MDIYWLGQACVKLKGKNATVLIDPYDPQTVGLKLPKDLAADMVLITHAHPDHNFTSPTTGIKEEKPMIFTEPGEYEVAGVVVTGVASFHDNTNGSERGVNTIFQLMFDRLNLVHLGDLGQHELTEAQIAQIGEVDILFVPVGGTYTIDGKTAASIVSQLEPKITIPIHYKPGLPSGDGKIEGFKLEELDGVESFLKEMGADVMPTPKLSITKDKLPEEPQVVVLTKS